jgi:Protein of unknown function (DUF3574)
MRSLILAVVLAATTGFAASAAIPTPGSTPTSACAHGLRPATTAELFFGGDGDESLAVTDADWKSFLADEVTPRFTGGLAVADVYSHQPAQPGFVREPLKAVFLVLTGTANERANLGYVRDAYKRRFHQDSVLLVEEKGCVAF